MPAVNKASVDHFQDSDWKVVALECGGVGVVLILALVALIAKRRSKTSNYPNLLNSQHSVAVKNALSKGPGSLKQSASPIQSPLSCTDSTPSPTTPFTSLLEDRTRRLSPSELPLERGKIDVTLSYDPLSLSLQVGVLSCSQLCELSLSPSGQCLLDPYVKLQLLPDKEHKVKTRIVRATTSPQFEEYFSFYGIGGEQLAASSLHLQVCAFDRYSRDAVVGEALFHLQDAQLLLNGSSALTLPLGPESFQANKGEVLLSLAYQSALNNLTIVVVKARGLSGTPDPYCKLSLRSLSGKRLMKKRTHVKRASRNPVYNESFVFELAQSQLKEAVIDVQMMQYINDHSECIGRVILSGNDTHVADAITGERQVAQWHTLE